MNRKLHVTKATKEKRRIYKSIIELLKNKISSDIGRTEKASQNMIFKVRPEDTAGENWG